MTQTQCLRELGQTTWLDGTNRELLHDGQLPRYINEDCITGLITNTSILQRAVADIAARNDWIATISSIDKSGEISLREQTLDDLWEATDLFRPVFNNSSGIDGWVAMEISPLAAGDIGSSIKAARQIQKQGCHPNLLINIPGTAGGLPVIEESIFAGIPVNVTLLFSCEQYLAAADAYQRGIERRLDAGLDPKVTSVASIVVNDWDRALRDIKSVNKCKQGRTAAALIRYDADRSRGIDPQIAAVTSMLLSGTTTAPVALPLEMRNQLGIAVAQRNYHAYCDVLKSSRWQKLSKAGAHPQRLLWAGTDTQDLDEAHDTLYIEALIGEGTITSMSEKTLRALKKHSAPLTAMTANNNQSEIMLERFAKAGVNIQALALKLQRNAMQSLFTSSNPFLMPSPSQTRAPAADRQAFA